MLTYTVSIFRYPTSLKYTLQLKLLITFLKINYNNNNTFILVYNMATSYFPVKFVHNFDPSISIFFFFLIDLLQKICQPETKIQACTFPTYLLRLLLLKRLNK